MAAPTTETISPAIRGFYAVLDRDDPAMAQRLVSRDGAGARVLQVRLKSPAATIDPEPRSGVVERAARDSWGQRPRSGRGSAIDTRELLRIATYAREITRAAGALLIVNDRLDVALAVGADGVHLGQDDLPLAVARELIERAGRGAAGGAARCWIGISTHDLAQVAAAVAGGADYLGFGPVFATATKANPDPVQGLAGLAAAVHAAGRVPVVGIGGVTPERATAVAATGAAAACCIAAVNDAPDIVQAGRAVAAAWAIPLVG